MKVYPKELLAYAAGFIDGEGCFYLGYRQAGKRRQCFPCTITVSQTNHLVLKTLSERFGGRVYEAKSSGAGSKRVFVWSIYGADADRLVRLIHRYLIVKWKDAVLFKAMRARINANRMGRRITPRELRERIDIVDTMKSIHSYRKRVAA